ncbi:MAG: hypothetical protein Q9209_003503 [Squamulea sp. 1 TL-2023]
MARYLSLPLTVFNNLYPVTNISIGIPPQPFTVRLDSAGSDTWVLSREADICKTSDCTLSGQYDERISETAISTDYQSDFRAMSAENPIYEGTLIKDTLTIGDGVIEDAEFGLVYKSRFNPGTPADGYNTKGMLALNYDKDQSEGNDHRYIGVLELMKEQDLISQRAYSLWLDRYSGLPWTGSIVFGGVDPTRYEPPLVTLPRVPFSKWISDHAAYPNVQYTSLVLNTVNGSELQDESVRSAIIDSATNGMSLPNDLANIIVHGFGGVYDPLFAWPMAPCDLRKADAEFVFRFGGWEHGVDIKIRVGDLMLPHLNGFRFKNGDNACVLEVKGHGKDFLLLGSTFLRSAYVVSHLDAGVIALANSREGPRLDDPDVQEITGDEIPGATKVVPVLPGKAPKPISTPLFHGKWRSWEIGDGSPYFPNEYFDGVLTLDAAKAAFTPPPVGPP